MVTAVGAGLTAAHRAGLTHRRLSGTNIVFGPDGPVICDLVQARAEARAAGADPVAGDVATLAGLARDLIDPADGSRDAEAPATPVAAGPTTPTSTCSLPVSTGSTPARSPGPTPRRLRHGPASSPPGRHRR